MTSKLIKNALEKMKTDLTGGIHSTSSIDKINDVSNSSSEITSQQIVSVSNINSLKNSDVTLEKNKSAGRGLNANSNSPSILRIDLRNVFCLKNRECHSSNLSTPIKGSSDFIDVNDIIKNIGNSILIFFDCRTFADFKSKHIKDSIHLNVRDKITKKRLQSQKITVKDLISCEKIKDKLGFTCSNATKNLISSCIVLYDETTSDIKDLLSDSNPLRIVKDNIEQCGFQQECKILKGGFKQFFEICPQFCDQKETNTILNQSLKKESDFQKDLDQFAIENAVMTEITSNIFLGNELDAKNIENLEKTGIFYILNVTKNVPCYHIGNSKFVNKKIEVNDCENQNLKQYFDEAAEFIDEAVIKNQKILIHCQMGISRSPSIVIAYLMKKSNLKLFDAYEMVREKRPIIAPNIVFMNQLMDYESNLIDIKTIPSILTSSKNSESYFQYPLIKNNEENKTILVCN